MILDGLLSKKIKISLIIAIFFSLVLLLAILLFSEYVITISLDKRLKLDIEEMKVTTRVDEKINVRMDSTISVPVNTVMEIYLNEDVMIDEIFDIKTVVPVSIVLTEKEVRLTNLEVPIETDIPIDEMIMVDTVIPIDATLKTYAGFPVKVKGNIPIKAAIPVRQMIHIKKNIVIDLARFKMALNMDLPIAIQAAINQPIKIKSTIPVEINETVKIPINAEIPVEILGPFKASIDVNEAITVKSGHLYLDAGAIEIRKK